MDMPMDCHVWGEMLEHCHRQATRQTGQHCCAQIDFRKTRSTSLAVSIEHRLVTDWEGPYHKRSGKRRRRIGGPLMIVIHHKVYSVIFCRRPRWWKLNRRSVRSSWNSAHTHTAFRSDVMLPDNLTLAAASATVLKMRRLLISKNTAVL